MEDPATPAAPVASSSGSRCRPSRSSDRWKTSTWHRTPSRATARRASWSGRHGGATSPLQFPASLNYLVVRLRAGESWRYQPAIDHTVGWVAVSTGRLRVPETVDAGELAIFEPSNDAIDFHAETDTEFVLGSADPHAHDLVLGRYSVHTSAATLRAAEQRLDEIRIRLQDEGRL